MSCRSTFTDLRVQHGVVLEGIAVAVVRMVARMGYAVAIGPPYEGPL